MKITQRSSPAAQNSYQVKATFAEPPIGGGGAFSIASFCVAHEIDRNHLRKMLADGTGPATMRLGGRILISYEAAAAWRARMTQTGSPAAKAQASKTVGKPTSASVPAGAL